MKGVFLSSNLRGRLINLEANNPVELGVKDETLGIFKGWASTAKKNSHGFTLLSKAWKDERAFQRYKDNPTVTYSHNLAWPVGNATLYEGRDEGLWAELEYERKAILPMGLSLGEMVDRGRVRGLSCAIDILEVELMEVGEDIEILVPAVELRDITMCAIPSDPGALASVQNEMTEFVNLCLSESKIKVGGFYMDPKLIRKMLGLAEDATEDQVVAKQNVLLQAAESQKNLRKNLGLKEDATEEEVALALKDRSPEKIANLETQVKRNKAKELVREHSKKIAPSLLEWAEELAFNDEKAFLAFVKAAPEGGAGPITDDVIPPDGDDKGDRRSTGLSLVKGSRTLTADDVKCMKGFGHFDDPVEMEKMANIKPNEALSLVFPGRKFRLTREDQDTLDRRNAMDEMVFGRR